MSGTRIMALGMVGDSDNNGLAVTTSWQALVSNPSESGVTYRVNTCWAGNVTVAMADADDPEVEGEDGYVEARITGLDRTLIPPVKIPPRSAQVLIHRDGYVYLLPGQSLEMRANANDRIEAIASLEILAVEEE